MATVELNLTDDDMKAIQDIAALRGICVEDAAGELFTEALVERLLRGLIPQQAGQVVPFKREVLA